jgi:hypothetical protein
MSYMERISALLVAGTSLWSSLIQVETAGRPFSLAESRSTSIISLAIEIPRPVPNAKLSQHSLRRSNVFLARGRNRDG